MTGILAHAMNQDGKIVTTSRDKHGDQVVTEETDIKLRFRYITDVDRNTNREGLGSEAMIWLSPDLAVVEGTILFAEDTYWRVQKLVKARRMSGSQVQFLKAFVNKHAV
jgi:hypothetical protein